MKKQLHILEGIMILVIVFIAFLLSAKFIYKIKHEKIDTTYMWNISLNNLNIKEGSKGTVSYTEEAINLDVTLNEFNEYSEFTIDIENNGSIDAILEDYLLNVENTTNILKYSVSYDNLEEIREGDILKSNSKRTILVKIYYPPQEEKIYPALELKLSLNMHYIANY